MAKSGGCDCTHFDQHGVTFEVASSIFHDPHLLTVADLEHGNSEERWFSVGLARSGAWLSVVYLWSESDSASVKVRIISARRATRGERRQYEEEL
ncbi:MAG TPA: BrnT family toxin [Bryobacteraceae bacterium]|nr:BrnT family toxin [Bryobacteraceae bacterium]